MPRGKTPGDIDIQAILAAVQHQGRATSPVEEGSNVKLVDRGNDHRLQKLRRDAVPD